MKKKCICDEPHSTINPDLSFEVGLAFIGNWCARALEANKHMGLQAGSTAAEA